MRIRSHYGELPDQVGDLWPPAGTPSDNGWPVAVVIHGGFWRAHYGMRLMHGLCADLARHGVAAWNIEYRRVGPRSPGGWPSTMDDVAAGIAHLERLAQDSRLDLARVLTVGHSAGGHLALWAAAPAVEPFAPLPLRIAGVLALAPVSDLELAAVSGVGGRAVPDLLGGMPEECPERYASASPAALLPLGVPQVVLHGTADESVPFAMSERYVNRARGAGDDAELATLAGVGHMALIRARSRAWGEGRRQALRLLAT